MKALNMEDQTIAPLKSTNEAICSIFSLDTGEVRAEMQLLSLVHGEQLPSLAVQSPYL